MFYKWAKSVNETRSLENIPEQELDKALANFFQIRKQNGDEYKPDTLTSMLRSFDRVLREQGKQYNLLSDRQFTKVREALSSKCKQLCRVGKGQKPNKALGLTETQIQMLWDEKQLAMKHHTVFCAPFGSPIPCFLVGEPVTSIIESSLEISKSSAKTAHKEKSMLNG